LAHGSARLKSLLVDFSAFVRLALVNRWAFREPRPTKYAAPPSS
jgi:hypothetical protein